MEQQKLFNAPAWMVGIAEVLNAGLLALTGYTIGQHETVLAITTGVAYAMLKKFVEKAQSKSETTAATIPPVQTITTDENQTS